MSECTLQSNWISQKFPQWQLRSSGSWSVPPASSPPATSAHLGTCWSCTLPPTESDTLGWGPATCVYQPSRWFWFKGTAVEAPMEGLNVEPNRRCLIPWVQAILILAEPMPVRGSAQTRTLFKTYFEKVLGDRSNEKVIYFSCYHSNSNTKHHLLL